MFFQHRDHLYSYLDDVSLPTVPQFEKTINQTRFFATKFNYSSLYTKYINGGRNTNLDSQFFTKHKTRSYDNLIMINIVASIKMLVESIPHRKLS